MQTILGCVIRDRGLKQKWLAKKLRIHEVDLCRYVTGSTFPRKKIRTKIAEYFNLNRDELFPPDGVEPNYKGFKLEKKPAPEGYISI